MDRRAVAGEGRGRLCAARSGALRFRRRGGVVFSGYALCGAHSCHNILVDSIAPPGSAFEDSSPEMLGWVTLHEIGHSLGLGHATNLEESTDLMGYGWPDLGDPVLSDCDVDALAFVFAWTLNGEDPHRPADGTVRLLDELEEAED